MQADTLLPLWLVLPSMGVTTGGPGDGRLQMTTPDSTSSPGLQQHQQRQQSKERNNERAPTCERVGDIDLLAVVLPEQDAHDSALCAPGCARLVVDHGQQDERVDDDGRARELHNLF